MENGEGGWGGGATVVDREKEIGLNPPYTDHILGGRKTGECGT